MKVTIHQPPFIGWLGFWAKIMQSDLFIVVSDWQFSNSSFEHRVKVEGSYLTLPVVDVSEKKDKFPLLSDLMVKPTTKQVKTLEQSYLRKGCKNTEIIEKVISVFKKSVNQEVQLVALNTQIMMILLGYLKPNFGVRFVHKETIDAINGKTEDKSERLLMLLSEHTPNYSQYLSGGGGLDYLDPKVIPNTVFQRLPKDLDRDCILKYLRDFELSELQNYLLTVGEFYE